MRDQRNYRPAAPWAAIAALSLASISGCPRPEEPETIGGVTAAAPTSIDRLPKDIPREVADVYSRPWGRIEILDAYADKTLHLTPEEKAALFDFLDKMGERFPQMFENFDYIATRPASKLPYIGGEQRVGGITLYVEDGDVQQAKTRERHERNPSKQVGRESAVFDALVSGFAHEFTHCVHLQTGVFDEAAQAEMKKHYETALQDPRENARFWNFTETYWFLDPEQVYIKGLSEGKTWEGLPYGSFTLAENIATVGGNWIDGTHQYLAESVRRASRGYPNCLEDVLMLAPIFTHQNSITFFNTPYSPTSVTRTTVEDKPFFRTADRIITEGFEFRVEGKLISSAVYQPSPVGPSVLVTFPTPVRIPDFFERKIHVAISAEIPTEILNQFWRMPRQLENL